jgi:hypothetical protein
VALTVTTIEFVKTSQVPENAEIVKVVLVVGLAIVVALLGLTTVADGVQAKVTGKLPVLVAIKEALLAEQTLTFGDTVS